MPHIDINKKRNDPNARVPLSLAWKEEIMHLNKDELIIPLGRDKSQKLHFINLKEWLHILSAGMALSGVGMFSRVTLFSLIKQRSHQDLRIILIDPIRRFSNFNNISHLLFPIIHKAKKALSALEWCVFEIERRYQILFKTRKKDIYSYNEKGNQVVFPNIVIFISELGELMPDRDIETALVRIAQMAKAVGIHLIIGTQMLNKEIITDLIFSNISVRVGFQVPSEEEAEVLEISGMETLIGQGDMIYQDYNGKRLELQGFHISDEEIEEFIKNEITDDRVNEEWLYKKAKKIILDQKQASATLLQRRLSIGYAKASRIIDKMEEEGLVSPQNGPKPRKILKQ